MHKINKKIVIEKINSLKLHRFDHPLPDEKLGLILGTNFSEWLNNGCDEIDISMLKNLSELFFVSESFFLNESEYSMTIPELTKYDELSNKIITCFVRSRKLNLIVPSTILPHELFSIPIREIRDWELQHYYKSINDYLLFTTKSKTKLSNKNDKQIQIHYDVVKKQCFISKQDNNTIQWFTLSHNQPLENNVNKDDLILLANHITLNCNTPEERQ